MKVGRNDSCPCGSGKKFKKCCLGNGKFDGPVAGPPPAEAASADQLTEALLAYAAPLIEDSDGSDEAMRRAIDSAKTFWDLSVAPAAEQEKMVTDVSMQAFDNDEDRATFRKLADEMIARHKTLFPQLHQK